MTPARELSPSAISRSPRNAERATRIREELRRFKERHRLLDARRAELASRYPDQWVALTPNGTIVAGESIDQVIEKIKQKGLSREGAAIKFMATKRRRMIV